jgi:hypothetical protein
VDLAGDYSSGANWRASATPSGNPGGPATTPGDFDANGQVDGADFLVWQRGFGGVYTAADLPQWRANVGSGSPAAASLRLSTAAETPETVGVSTALIAADHLSENAKLLNAAGSGVTGMAALTRGPRWFVVTSGEVASSKLPRETKELAAAIDAAFAEWTPRRRCSFATDDFIAAIPAKGHRSGEYFEAPERRGSVQRSLSLRDHVRLTFRDVVVKSLDRA